MEGIAPKEVAGWDREFDWNDTIPQSLQENLAAVGDLAMRLALAKRPDTTPAALTALSKLGIPEVTAALDARADKPSIRRRHRAFARKSPS